RTNYIKEEKEQDLVRWAIKGLFRRLDEKVPPDLQQRMKDIKDAGEKELAALLADARERLGKREDLENQKDLNIAMVQMTSHLDPYSTYLPQEDRQFGQETT